MKGKQAISAPLFMSFLVLVTRGKDVQYKRQEEDNTQILKETSKRMKDGDVYDCIDVNEQPTFRHPLLKDHKVQMQPNSFPVWMDIQTLPSDEPSTIECPTGTIPILHTNGSDTIAAHSYDGQLESAGLIYQGDVYGVRGVLNVWEPKPQSWSWSKNTTTLCLSWKADSNTHSNFQGIIDPVSKNWWLTYEHVAIGYWPSALFEFLRNKGDAAFWGGIVEGPTASSNSLQMGSGHFASEGYGGAAFVKNIQLANNEKGYFDTPNNSQVRPESSDKSKYTVERFEYSKYVGMRIFYGGLGSYKAY
ncbi:hypothetical protein VPH35_107601 [Triticum aestivum]